MKLAKKTAAVGSMSETLTLGRFVGVSPSSLVASSIFNVGVDFLPSLGEPVESVEAILLQVESPMFSNRSRDMMWTILKRYVVLQGARPRMHRATRADVWRDCNRQPNGISLKGGLEVGW